MARYKNTSADALAARSELNSYNRYWLGHASEDAAAARRAEAFRETRQRNGTYDGYKTIQTSPKAESVAPGRDTAKPLATKPIAKPIAKPATRPVSARPLSRRASDVKDRVNRMLREPRNAVRNTTKK